MFWADLVGAKHICARLTEWAQKYGDFFEPCTFLKERAASGVKLVREGLRLRVQGSGPRYGIKLDANGGSKLGAAGASLE